MKHATILGFILFCLKRYSLLSPSYFYLSQLHNLNIGLLERHNKELLNDSDPIDWKENGLVRTGGLSASASWLWIALWGSRSHVTGAFKNRRTGSRAPLTLVAVHTLLGEVLAWRPHYHGPDLYPPNLQNVHLDGLRPFLRRDPGSAKQLQLVANRNL